MSIQVVKADGTTEFFKVEKLRRSLRRSGATVPEVQSIIKYIEMHLYDGIRTQEIYRAAFDKLRSHEMPAAARYSLRRAMFNLGPTGFPFEAFLGRLFAAQGYEVKVGTIVSGQCVDHEIDLAAYKKDHSFVAEAKFHSRPAVKSDLQVALYCYARFLDLKGKQICTADICSIKEFRLITNTKFTKTAEKYAGCVGLPLLSWDYPRHNNLHDLIQRHGLYPVTILQSISAKEIGILLSHNIILCSEIPSNTGILKALHLNLKKQEKLLAEVNAICKNGTAYVKA